MKRLELEGGGARAVKAEVGSFEVQRLDFPAGHRIPFVDRGHGYVVLVLDGAMQKRFASDDWSLARDSFATLPEGSGHATEFGRDRTLVVSVHPAAEESKPLFAALLRRRRHTRAGAATAIGRRLACELSACDASWGLAAEGLVLQLLAAFEREGRPRRDSGRCAAAARDVLHERAPASPTLDELSVAVGVGEAELARTFRREYGLTVAQYSRSLRLDWTAGALAGDASLAEIAFQAGFADQSHFTRAFRAYAGITPGRYRELLRG